MQISCFELQLVLLLLYCTLTSSFFSHCFASNSKTSLLHLYDRIGDRRSSSDPLSSKWYKDKQRSITSHQKKILQQYSSKYVHKILYNTTINLNDLFNIKSDSFHNNDKYVILDIGFGAGESTLFLSSSIDKNRYYIGCEIHKGGIAKTIEKIEYRINHHISNSITSNTSEIKLFRIDVNQLLKKLPDDCLNEAYILFPDPWGKRIDENKRVVRLEVLQHLSRKMKKNCVLYISTDVQDYANHIKNITNVYNDYNESYGNKWFLIEEYKHQPTINLPSYRAVSTYEIKSNSSFVWNYQLKNVK